MEGKHHPKSQEDFLAGLAFYDGRSIDVGDDFLREFDETVDAIRQNPETRAVIWQDVREREMPRFPFNLVYVCRKNVLRIMAVAHHSRRRWYWKKRLKDLNP
ncbi:MAG: hypothetical protein U0793_19250 [Gemmataceae bacterium]